MYMVNNVLLDEFADAGLTYFYYLTYIISYLTDGRHLFSWMMDDIWRKSDNI